MKLHIQSTISGQLVRWVSRNAVFKYPDEIDSSLWKRAVQPTPSQDSQKPSRSQEPEHLNGEPQQNEDVEANGSDVVVVGWYGPDDPEVGGTTTPSPPPGPSIKNKVETVAEALNLAQNPQNWPRNLKQLIAFQMCILNFAVYIASSIYVPGEMDLMDEFGVDEVVAR